MRHAVYYAPAVDDPLWHFGCDCLGYDAVTGLQRAHPVLPGWSGEALRAATTEPRRYGFHATLKAPFRLASHCGTGQLHEACAAFASTREPLNLGRLALRPLGNFLALQPVAAPAELRAWAFDCVRSLDPFRALPTLAELQHRQRAPLTQRQQALLTAWGYPHVDDQFHFHMTLSNGLPDGERMRLADSLVPLFAPLARADCVLDAISLFVEAEPGAPFRLAERFPLAG